MKKIDKLDVVKKKIVKQTDKTAEEVDKAIYEIKESLEFLVNDSAAAHILAKDLKVDLTKPSEDEYKYEFKCIISSPQQFDDVYMAKRFASLLGAISDVIKNSTLGLVIEKPSFGLKEESED